LSLKYNHTSSDIYVQLHVGSILSASSIVVAVFLNNAYFFQSIVFVYNSLCQTLGISNISNQAFIVIVLSLIDVLLSKLLSPPEEIILVFILPLTIHCHNKSACSGLDSISIDNILDRLSLFDAKYVQVYADCIFDIKSILACVFSSHTKLFVFPSNITKLQLFTNISHVPSHCVYVPTPLNSLGNLLYQSCKK
jgi:hypothetical protein